MPCGIQAGPGRRRGAERSAARRGRAGAGHEDGGRQAEAERAAEALDRLRDGPGAARGQAQEDQGEVRRRRRLPGRLLQRGHGGGAAAAGARRRHQLRQCGRAHGAAPGPGSGSGRPARAGGRALGAGVWGSGCLGRAGREGWRRRGEGGRKCPLCWGSLLSAASRVWVVSAPRSRFLPPPHLAVL